jgi:hypothetical protein
MRSLNEWDDLGPADYNKSSARREAKEEIEEELDLMEDTAGLAGS